MFKSLRRKFITTAVGSVAVVIAILAIALNFINYYKLEERIDTTLLDASKSQALIKILQIIQEGPGDRCEDIVYDCERELENKVTGETWL